MGNHQSDKGFSYIFKANAVVYTKETVPSSGRMLTPKIQTPNSLNSMYEATMYRTVKNEFILGTQRNMSHDANAKIRYANQAYVPPRAHVPYSNETSVSQDVYRHLQANENVSNKFSTTASLERDIARIYPTPAPRRVSFAPAMDHHYEEASAVHCRRVCDFQANCHRYPMKGDMPESTGAPGSGIKYNPMQSCQTAVSRPPVSTDRNEQVSLPGSPYIPLFHPVDNVSKNNHVVNCNENTTLKRNTYFANPPLFQPSEGVVKIFQPIPTESSYAASRKIYNEGQTFPVTFKNKGRSVLSVTDKLVANATQNVNYVSSEQLYGNKLFEQKKNIGKYNSAEHEGYNTSFSRSEFANVIADEADTSRSYNTYDVRLTVETEGCQKQNNSSIMQSKSTFTYNQQPFSYIYRNTDVASSPNKDNTYAKLSKVKRNRLCFCSIT